MRAPTRILYLKPHNKASCQPVIDRYTKMMTAAFRKGVVGRRTNGHHECICGVHSHNADYLLTNGVLTNSLCIHYLTVHRDEVPVDVLQKVAALNCGEADPNEIEIASPFLLSRG